MSNASKARKNNQQRVYTVNVKCPRCNHKKAFDKQLLKVVSGVFCCRCGAKVK